MTRRRLLLSLLSLGWLLGLAHAVQSWPPRGGAWFGRRGNRNEKIQPSATVSKSTPDVNETTTTTAGGGIKRSTKSPRSESDKKKTHIKKIRKKRRKRASPDGAVGHDESAEEQLADLKEGRSRGRSTTRSRRRTHHRQAAINGETKKTREKVTVGLDQKPRRKMKKMTKHTSSSMEDHQSHSDMLMLGLTVPDDGNTVERKYRPMKRSEGKKRPKHKSSVNQFVPRQDLDVQGHNQASGDMEHGVRSKKLKKKKLKKATSVRRAPPLSLSDDEGEMTLRPKKSKKRKRERSTVKGESTIGRVQPVAEGNLDSVDKVQHTTQTIKTTLKKKKKVKKMKHHKVPAVSSDGSVAVETGHEGFVVAQAIETTHLPVSADLNVDDAMTNPEAIDDGKQTELPQLEVLDKPDDPSVPNAVADADVESLQGIDLSSALYQAALGLEQGELASDESVLTESKAYESQEVDGSAVPGVDEAVSKPPNKEEEAEPQDIEADDLTALEDQCENEQLQRVERESSMDEARDLEELHRHDKINQLDGYQQEHIAEVTIDGEHISNAYPTLTVDRTDDDDALDELVEALIQDQLDESELNDAARIDDISENETMKTSLETLEEVIESKEEGETWNSGDSSLPSGSSRKDAVEAPRYLFDTKDQGDRTENPATEETDDFVGESLMQSTSEFSTHNFNYGPEEVGKTRESINKDTDDQRNYETEEPMSVLEGVSFLTDDFVELKSVSSEGNSAVYAVDDEMSDVDVLSSGSPAPNSVDINAVATDDDAGLVAGDDVDSQQVTVEDDALIIESNALTGKELAKEIFGAGEEDADEADGEHIKGDQSTPESDVLESEAIKPLDQETAEKDTGAETTVNVDEVRDSEGDILNPHEPSDPQSFIATPLVDEDQVKDDDRKEDQNDIDHMEAIQTSLNIIESSSSALEAETEEKPIIEAESILLDRDDGDESATKSFSSLKGFDNEISGRRSEVVKTDVKPIIESSDDPSDITVSVVSWNLAEAVVPEEDAAFIRKFRKTPGWRQDGEDGSDIVLISSQECENIKPRRSEGHRSRELRRLMIKMLGKNYVPLAIHSLGGIQFGLFCKRSILSEIEFVSVADVTCGIGNVFHNKGAIAAFLQMKSRDPTGSNAEHATKHRANSVKMLFVTAHLAAHVKNVDARNMDYWRIASELQAQAPSRFLPTQTEGAAPRRGVEWYWVSSN